MKLTTKERAAMAAMMVLADEKLKGFPPTTGKLGREDRHLINKLADVRNGLREVLSLA